MNVVFLFSVCEKSLPFFFLVMISFWSHLNQQSTFHLQLPLGHFEQLEDCVTFWRPARWHLTQPSGRSALFICLFVWLFFFKTQTQLLFIAVSCWRLSRTPQYTQHITTTKSTTIVLVYKKKTKTFHSFLFVLFRTGVYTFLSGWCFVCYYNPGFPKKTAVPDGA